MNIPEVTTSTNAEPETERVQLDMVCDCDPLSDDTKALREWADGYFTGTGGRFSQAVMALHWNYDALVEDIGCDQWFGIVVVKFDRSLSVGLFCDSLEDGIAAIVRYFEGRFGAGKAEVQL